jgi:hypothetical protein
LADSRQRQVIDWASHQPGYVGHRPGFALLTDQQVAEREAARRAYVRGLESSWDARRKKPDPDDDPDADEDALDRERSTGTDPRSIADARAIADAAYRRMVARLGRAWRTPSRDAAEPQGTRPEESLARPMSGRADPSRAAAVARQTEAAKGASIEELAANLERDRDRLHQQRKQDLQNAWKR